jgi:hydrogenase expression/formation protein HypC
VCLAIPGKLLSKSEENGMLRGRVEFGGIVREACLDFLPEAEVGDYVLVHVGFAITRIDEQEAQETLAYLQELGSLQEELGDLAEDAITMIPTEVSSEAS